MKKHTIWALVCVILAGSVASGQWTIYECNELPSLADPVWTPRGQGPTPNVEDWFYSVNDPVIPGNKLLLMEELTLAGKENYYTKWGANKDIGATVVFRLKASDNFAANKEKLSEDSTASACWGTMEVRNGLYREKIDFGYSLYRGKDKYGLTLSKSNEAGQESAVYFSDDDALSDWHVYRLTIQNEMAKVYVDEDPTPAATGETTALTPDSYLLIGDMQPNYYMASLYDWIIWDVTGAYPPKQGTPIPRSLIGWHTGIEDEDLYQPEDFKLYPNFPNPFNPHTTIQFELIKAGYVSLTVYDVNGRLIRKLLEENRGGGRHQVTWNGQDDSGLPAAAGVYVYEIRFENMKKRGKMMLLK